MSHALRSFASSTALVSQSITSHAQTKITVPIIQACSSLLTSTSTSSQSHYSTTPSVHSRRAAREAKQAEYDAYMKRMMEKQTSDDQISENSTKDEKEQKQIEEKAQNDRDQIRKELLSEAGEMTKSLYRTCLRSIKIIRPGNENDEADFSAREEAQRKEMDEMDLSSSSISFSYTPPVDRENELQSRAEYYRRWMREEFNQESDCLEANPWMEEHVERYLYFIKGGEEKRCWILNDYKFEDTHSDAFDYERVDRFEERAMGLVQGFYKERGWILDKERGLSHGGDDDDDFFSDDEDEEERKR